MRVPQQLKNSERWSHLKGWQFSRKQSWGISQHLGPTNRRRVAGERGAWLSSAPSLLLPVGGQALEALLLSGMLTLVLEEDGTAVESEDFFQLLEDDTCLMVLEYGQSWSPSRVRGPQWGCC